MTWRRDAACIGADPTLFDEQYPDNRYRGRWSARQEKQIVSTITRYCGTCPVVAHCWLEAERDRETGIRGGQLRISHGVKATDWAVKEGRLTRRPASRRR